MSLSNICRVFSQTLYPTIIGENIPIYGVQKNAFVSEKSRI